MATASGTATDYLDLLARLKAFLTVTLAGDAWTALRDVTGPPSELILRAPGAAGVDEIFVGIQTIENLSGDYFNWNLGGFTGFDAGLAFRDQPGFSLDTPSPLHLPLWNAAIPYWFVGSGRRMVVVAKVSTRYLWCYLGFPTTYASPGQYPYPLIVGGPLSWGNVVPPAVTSATWRWSYTGSELANPSQSIYNSGFQPATFSGRSNLRLRMGNGAWRDIWATGGFFDPFNQRVTQIGDKPTNNTLAGWRDIPELSAKFGSVWPHQHNLDAMDPALDGNHVLLPVILMAGTTSGDTPDLIGELDGVSQVAGGATAEDIITVGGVNHLVVPNVFRSNRADFVAIRLS